MALERGRLPIECLAIRKPRLDLFHSRSLPAQANLGEPEEDEVEDRLRVLGGAEDTGSPELAGGIRKALFEHAGGGVFSRWRYPVHC